MHLLRRIEVFLQHGAVSATRLGREALGDPRFVSDLRHGRRPRPQTAARALAWIEGKEGEAQWRG